MPELLEIRRGYDIGKPWRNKYIYAPCEDCGKPRWVQYSVKNKKPVSRRCADCGDKVRTQKLVTFASKPRSPEYRHRLSLSKRGNKNPLWKQTGERNSHWKGGRIKRADGYIMVLIPYDDFYRPMADKRGYVMEHRLIMANHLTRCLLPWEVVHHKNGVRNDNKIENLEIFPNPARHDALSKISDYIQGLQAKIERLERELNEARQNKPHILKTEKTPEGLAKVGHRLAENRAHWHCEICHRYVSFIGEFGLSGHHIIKRSQLGKDIAENCIIACGDCHNHQRFAEGIPISRDSARKIITENTAKMDLTSCAIIKDQME